MKNSSVQNSTIPVDPSYFGSPASAPEIKAPLCKLVDQQILENLSNLVKTERKLTLQILHHLAEVEARRLFAREGYPSLFAFCTEKLGYTEGAAMRRINAMRLLSKVPEAESKVMEGKINLTQLSQIKQMQSVEEKQTGKKFSKEESLNLMSQLEGKSTRETDRHLTALSPALEEKKKCEEKIKPVSANLTSITLTADQELIQLIEQGRSMLANNQNMNPSLSELFKQSLKVWITQKQVKRGDIQKDSPTSPQLIQCKAPKSPSDQLLESELNPSNTSASGAALVSASAPAVLGKNVRSVSDKISGSKTPIKLTLKKSRYFPMNVRRALYQRAQGQCEFRAASSSESRCQSKHALEIHHIRPFAKQGSNELNNLQIRCRGHNDAQAIWDFGLKWR